MDKFFEKMRDLLQDEYDAFLESMKKPAFRGMRVNTLKCSSEDVLSLVDFKTEKTPFFKDGYYKTK